MQGLVIALGAVFLSAAASAQATWPGDAWERATPESQGMDSARLQEVIDFGAANRMDSVVVVRHGKLVAEAYYAPFRAGMRHRLNSATKAVTVSLVRIAQSQGKLPDANVPMLPLLGRPAEGPQKDVTLQQLMDMTAGIDWREALLDAVLPDLDGLRRAPNAVDYVLARPMAHAPGERFTYSSGNSHLISAIVGRAVQANAREYALRELFGPLGIRDVRWQADPQGVTTGGYGLYLNTPDMARIGYLYLRGGEWNGKQLLPRAAVQRVFQPRVPMHLLPGTDWHYADGWWALPQRGAFFAMGYMRQMIIVMPAQDLVIASTARTLHSVEQLLDRIEAAVKSPGPVAENAAAQQALAGRIAAVGAPAPQAAALPPAASAVSGKVWRFGANAVGMRELVLHFDGTPRFEMLRSFRDNPPVRHQGPLGMDGAFAGPPQQVARGRWMDERTLAIEVRMPEEAEVYEYLLKFDGDRVDIGYANNFGFRAQFSGAAR